MKELLTDEIKLLKDGVSIPHSYSITTVIPAFSPFPSPILTHFQPKIQLIMVFNSNKWACFPFIFKESVESRDRRWDWPAFGRKVGPFLPFFAWFLALYRPKTLINKGFSIDRFFSAETAGAERSFSIPVAVNSSKRPWKIVTVQPAPFVKPHCVLIVAKATAHATVLLINGRFSHGSARLKNHASMIFSLDPPYGWTVAENKQNWELPVAKAASFLYNGHICEQA